MCATYEIISGGKLATDGLIIGPFCVTVIKIEGNSRKVSSMSSNLQSIEAATKRENDYLDAYHGATFPWGRIAELA